VIEQPCLRF